MQKVTQRFTAKLQEFINAKKNAKEINNLYVSNKNMSGKVEF